MSCYIGSRQKFVVVPFGTSIHPVNPHNAVVSAVFTFLFSSEIFTKFAKPCQHVHLLSHPKGILSGVFTVNTGQAVGLMQG